MKARELVLVGLSMLAVAQEGAFAQGIGVPGRGGPPVPGRGGFEPSPLPMPPPNPPSGPTLPPGGEGHRDDYGLGGGWDRGGGWGRGGHGHHRPPPQRGYPGYGRLIDVYRAQQIVDAIYVAFLFRRVDPQSLNYAVYLIQSGGISGLSQLAQQIAMSPEFSQRILRMYRPEQIVGNAYSILFRRAPDYSSQYYVQLLLQGRITDALVSLVQSQEFAYNYLY